MLGVHTTQRQDDLRYMREEFKYRWVWGQKFPRTLDRKGQRCRVLVRGKRNSALIEFEDGFKVIVSRNGLRRDRP